MIGEMDQIITLQASAATADGLGGETRTWAPIGTDPDVWAKVTVRRGSEAMEDGRMNARQMALFEIWNRDDLSELVRVLWRGEAWNVRAVQRSSDRRMTIIIEAERGAA